ncbi:MAG: tetratricopeptide repeat protein [Lentisphaeria bacterium]|nr:tetratricopeptide repeat protein [Lentisphaeria bacterium]
MKKLLLLTWLALATGGAFAAPKPSQTTFLFPEASTPIGLNRAYGEQAMADHLYKNAIKYFTAFATEAKTTTEKMDASMLLGRAYLLDGQPAEALKIVNACLGANDLADASPKKATFFLTAGQASLLQKDYATALNFLEPLLSYPAEIIAPMKYELLCATADSWNATAQWNLTFQTLQKAIEEFGNGSAERIGLTWRFLDAAQAQSQWNTVRATLAELSVTQLSETERTTLKLLHIRCDIGEGKIEDALSFYRNENLSSLLPAASEKKWWSVLWDLAQACQNRNLQKDAAELYSAARRVAPTHAEALETGMLQAEAQIAIGDRENAKTLLLSLHEQAPQNTSITLRLAEVRKALGERRSASELFQLLAEDPQHPRKLRYRTAMEAAQCLAQEGLAQEATKYFRLAGNLGDSPQEQAAAIRMAAEQAEKNRQLDDAVAFYTEVAERFGDAFPQAPESRLEAGRILLLAGKTDDAIVQYRKFLEAQPESPRRWEALLAIGKSTADTQDALDKLLEVARNCPNAQIGETAFFEAHNRALAQGEAGMEKALAILQEFLAKYPDAEKVRLVRHKNLILGFALGKPETTQWANAFLLDYPASAETPEIAIRLGDCLAAQNHPQDAIDAYAKAEGYSQASRELKALAHYENAFCTAQLPGEQEKALALLEDFEKRTGDSALLAQASFLQGDLFSRLNQPTEAIAAFAKAREKSGNRALIAYAALGRMAELLYAQGNLAKAEEYLDEIIRNNAGNDIALRARTKLIRARCYHLAKNEESAKRLYQEIRLEYESLRKIAPQEAPSPRIYVIAVQELLEILDAQQETASARTVRENYRRIPGLPALPATSQTK